MFSHSVSHPHPFSAGAAIFPYLKLILVRRHWSHSWKLIFPLPWFSPSFSFVSSIFQSFFLSLSLFLSLFLSLSFCQSPSASASVYDNPYIPPHSLVFSPFPHYLCTPFFSSFREDYIAVTARDIYSKIPLTSMDIGTYDPLQTRAKILVRNGTEIVTPCQVVLLQELERWNNLVKKMASSLADLQRALVGKCCTCCTCCRSLLFCL